MEDVVDCDDKRSCLSLELELVPQLFTFIYFVIDPKSDWFLDKRRVVGCGRNSTMMQTLAVARTVAPTVT